MVAVSESTPLQVLLSVVEQLCGVIILSRKDSLGVQCELGILDRSISKTVMRTETVPATY